MKKKTTSPRTRGDDPTPVTSGATVATFSPHPRG